MNKKEIKEIRELLQILEQNGEDLFSNEIYVRDEDPDKKIEVRIDDLRKIIEYVDECEKRGYKIEKVSIIENE